MEYSIPPVLCQQDLGTKFVLAVLAVPYKLRERKENSQTAKTYEAMTVSNTLNSDGHHLAPTNPRLRRHAEKQAGWNVCVCLSLTSPWQRVPGLATAMYLQT